MVIEALTERFVAVPPEIKKSLYSGYILSETMRCSKNFLGMRFAVLI